MVHRLPGANGLFPDSKLSPTSLTGYHYLLVIGDVIQGNKYAAEHNVLRQTHVIVKIA